MQHIAAVRRVPDSKDIADVSVSLDVGDGVAVAKADADRSAVIDKILALLHDSGGRSPGLQQ